MDETSVAKGHDYITLFVDLYKKAVVHISNGKSAKTVHDFVATLEQQNGNKEQVKAISCDMSPAFIKGVCKAMRMRETFQKIYQAPDMQTFRHLLQKWYHWVSQCSLHPSTTRLFLTRAHLSELFSSG
ncbi:hypothetical protein BPUTSESOX_2205 [uncultured Gammaproteobacteria bacterium]|uniref:transposase n=1 Tax=thiotrophic endosymbiont of Bathymodiolus puteoserpentis (Logatchev) TaxID=343240 RepID=UPI0010B10F82|nr:transposase [thiotrophic endosymbiont of Bathymodiolus puteoserpentis (Logatchev)]CAC9588844.1 hypothetical protein [uncultured Gammaproteobacteria bacterium]SSC09856.1 hypothetical protein BPUTEOSOX_711 [thiotrophic endosymbiont of Bathymodiolus puteoserpentis (Logatchev)]VVH51441.1 hypothetical protein BPUTSESOX_2205 [uncultured Gammaproteobacteria bacterium]